MAKIREIARFRETAKTRKSRLLPRKVTRGLRVARVGSRALFGGARLIGRSAWKGGKLSATARARARAAAVSASKARRGRRARTPRASTHGRSRQRSRATPAVGTLAGAAGMYFFDPRSGRRRRHLLRDKARKAARRRVARTSREMRYGKGVIAGRLHEAKARPGKQGAEEPDDVTLARKVESEVFRDHSIPKGKINVNSEGGVIYLRGELASAAEIERVITRASAVEGIHGVRSLLHTPSDDPPAPPRAQRVSVGDGATGLK